MRLMNEDEAKAWEFIYNNCVGTFFADINYQYDTSELAVLASLYIQEIVENETFISMMDYWNFPKKFISKDNFHYGIEFSKKKTIRNMNENTLKTIDLFIGCKTKYRDSLDMMASRAMHQAKLTIVNATVENAIELLEKFIEESEKIPYGMSAETLAKHISAWAKMSIPAEIVAERLEHLQIFFRKDKGIKIYAMQLEDDPDLTGKWFAEFLKDN